MVFVKANIPDERYRQSMAQLAGCSSSKGQIREGMGMVKFLHQTAKEVEASTISSYLGLAKTLELYSNVRNVML